MDMDMTTVLLFGTLAVLAMVYTMRRRSRLSRENDD
jgi:hypothetical protein